MNLNGLSLNEQCKRVRDEALRLAREEGDLAAQAYFNQATETWPTFATCELGAEIRKLRTLRSE